MRKWYLYTRNRAQILEGTFASCQITADGTAASLASVPLHGKCLGKTNWISFSGDALFDYNWLRVQPDSKEAITIRNSTSIEDWRECWPAYERSGKHRSEPYVRETGERVSPMQLSDSEALQLLLVSVEHEGERFACREGVYFRFLRTYPDREVFHGFMIPAEQVPREIADLLQGLR